MLKRLAQVLPRLFASALIVFLFAQPFTALAFDDCSGMSSMACCKDKCCCRRMHHASMGTGLTSKDCCGQCHISIRNTQPVATSIDPPPPDVKLAPVLAKAVFHPAWVPLTRPNPVLFERPPPSVA